MKITIIYDNEVKRPGLKADHGFSCLIEIQGVPQILFDTGAKASILLHNMSKLGINPGDIGIVVISHSHWDHIGGLKDILEVNKDVELYLPQSLQQEISAGKVTRAKQPFAIRRSVFSTGELKGVEQSLVINTDKGLLVVVGCSHSGVDNILSTASGFGRVYGIIGGLHGFNDFSWLNGLSLICPCHCTQHKSEIRHLFPQQSLECGAGMVIEL